jgi:hypothetical protein
MAKTKLSGTSVSPGTCQNESWGMVSDNSGRPNERPLIPDRDFPKDTVRSRQGPLSLSLSLSLSSVSFMLSVPTFCSSVPRGSAGWFALVNCRIDGPQADHLPCRPHQAATGLTGWKLRHPSILNCVSRGWGDIWMPTEDIGGQTQTIKNITIGDPY